MRIFSKQEKEIKAIARRGYGIRPIARLLGISSNTVSRYYPYDEHILCMCGQDVFHKGWCGWRIMQSPERLAFLRRWAYRESGLLISCSMKSLHQTAAITLRKSNVPEEEVTHIDILKAIKARVHESLQPALMDDLVQEMFLEVLENRTPLHELGRVVQNKLRGQRGEVSRFKMMSLDEFVPGTQVRYMDTIASDRFHF